MIIGLKQACFEFITIHIYPAICFDFSKIAKSLSEKNKVNADNYHYFSYDNKDGITGGATTASFANSDAGGSVCLRDQKLRTAISEWLNSDAETAIVIHLKIN